MAKSEIKTICVTQSELQRTLLKAGDLLLVEGHGNPDEIGRCAVWDGSIHPCVHQNHLIRVQPDRKLVLPIFLSYFLNSEGGRRQLVKAGKTTSGLNTINTNRVRETRVMVPPLDLQCRFQESSERIAALKVQLITGLDKDSLLFQAIQQRAFRGEL